MKKLLYIIIFKKKLIQQKGMKLFENLKKKHAFFSYYQINILYFETNATMSYFN